MDNDVGARDDRLRVLCAGVYAFERFKAALSVVLAYAAYLPSARCFVLLPLLSQVPCTSCSSQCVKLEASVWP